MYMLNLVFKIPPPGNQHLGKFSGDDDTPGTGIPSALRQSLNWLQLKGDDPSDPYPPAFDPEAADWTDLGKAETLYLPSAPDPGWICIRAAQHRGRPVALRSAKLVVSFGRPVRAHQEQASPFTDNESPNGHIVTTFVPDLALPKHTTSRGWFLSFGKIGIRPTKHPALCHRYEFSTGLIVTTDSGEEYCYGEDPEMDIGM